MSELKQQLIKYQDEINKALAGLPFAYSERLSFSFRVGEFPKVINHHMPRPCWGLQPVYLRNLTDDAAYPTDGLYIDWIPESGGIKIRGINGLMSTDLYKIELVAYS